MTGSCSLSGGLDYTHHGGVDSLFLQLDPQLSPEWGFHIAGTEDQYIAAVGSDPSGNLLAAGSFASSVDFGGTLLDGGLNADAFIIKLLP